MVVCKRCVIDDSIPGVVFDDEGVCNYCHIHDEMSQIYPIDIGILHNLVKQIKSESNGSFDAVIGVSGGCDSSYMLDLMNRMGLRLLAVHVDNGWNTSIARTNMMKITKQLGVPFETVRLDTRVFDSLCRSFLYAGTPDADIVNDLALLEGISQVALDKDIKYVLNGHSFRTEGTAPLGWTYMDGGYLEDVNKCFEDIDLGGFPHLSWDKQMEFWNHGIKTIRPMYYVRYNKDQAIQYLINNYRWRWYRGLHAENIYTKFVGNYLWVKKFKIDYRKIEYSALMRSGFKTRDESFSNLSVGKSFEQSYLDSILRRLGLSDVELENDIIKGRVHSYKEYGNYLERFRDPIHRPMFDTLFKEGKIPYTFYKKYIMGV